MSDSRPSPSWSNKTAELAAALSPRVAAIKPTALHAAPSYAATRPTAVPPARRKFPTQTSSAEPSASRSCPNSPRYPPRFDPGNPPPASTHALPFHRARFETVAPPTRSKNPVAKSVGPAPSPRSTDATRCTAAARFVGDCVRKKVPPTAFHELPSNATTCEPLVAPDERSPPTTSSAAPSPLVSAEHIE